MSEFYARIQGSRGEATRCGTKSSGIETTTETWHSIISTEHHCSSTAASGHEATVRIAGKYGGSVLTLLFDADTLYAQSDDPQVRKALSRVWSAMREADAAAQRAAGKAS